MFRGNLYFLNCEVSLHIFGLFLTVFFFFLINLFIFGCVGFSLLCGLSLAAARGGYSLSRCAGFSLQWLLLLRSTGSRRVGFSSCDTWAQ